MLLFGEGSKELGEMSVLGQVSPEQGLVGVLPKRCSESVASGGTLGKG